MKSNYFNSTVTCKLLPLLKFLFRLYYILVRLYIRLDHTETPSFIHIFRYLVAVVHLVFFAGFVYVYLKKKTLLINYIVLQSN